MNLTDTEREALQAELAKEAALRRSVFRGFKQALAERDAAREENVRLRRVVQAARDSLAVAPITGDDAARARLAVIEALEAADV